jgi:hypothetical protein
VSARDQSLFDAQDSLFHVRFESSLNLSNAFWLVVSVHGIHGMQSIGLSGCLAVIGDRHLTPNTSKLRNDLET